MSHIVVSPQVAIFVILAATCLAGPHLFHLPRITPHDRTYILLTLTFLAWVLLFMAGVRSR